MAATTWSISSCRRHPSELDSSIRVDVSPAPEHIAVQGYRPHPLQRRIPSLPLRHAAASNRCLFSAENVGLERDLSMTRMIFEIFLLEALISSIEPTYGPMFHWQPSTAVVSERRRRCCVVLQVLARHGRQINGGLPMSPPSDAACSEEACASAWLTAATCVAAVATSSAPPDIEDARVVSDRLIFCTITIDHSAYSKDK